MNDFKWVVEKYCPECGENVAIEIRHTNGKTIEECLYKGACPVSHNTCYNGINKKDQPVVKQL